MTVKLLKVQVQPVFVHIDDAGDVTEYVGEPTVVAGKEWPGFSAAAYGAKDLAAVGSQIGGGMDLETKEQS